MSNKDIEIKFPDGAKDELEKMEKKLSKIEDQYSDIIEKSFKNFPKRLIRHGQIKNLKKELDILKTNAVILYSIYGEDENFKNDLQDFLDKIDVICYRSGIKPLEVKIKPKKYKTEIINRLKIIKGINSALDKEMNSVNSIENKTKEFFELQEKLETLVEKAEQFKIIVSNEEEILKIKLEERSLPSEQSLQQEYSELKKDYNDLLDKCKNGDLHWQDMLNKVSSFLEDLNKLAGSVSNFSKNLRSIKTLSNIDNEISKTLEANKKLDKKITFAKKIQEYVVFDNNMGIEIKNANDSLEKMRKTKYGEYVNCASQPCLKIAQGQRMSKQYNHNKFSLFRGPYYILVDKKGNQIKEAFTTKSLGGSLTINKSSAQPAAEQEVENYLKHALQAGEFKSDKNWIK